MLETFGIERSLSAKGCPHDSAVDESADGIPRAELARREAFGTMRELRAKLSDYVHRYDNFRIHSASPAVDRPASALVTLALEWPSRHAMSTLWQEPRSERMRRMASR